MQSGWGVAARRWKAAALVAAGLVCGAANAAFIDRGGGVILDDVTNLEWEQTPTGPFTWAQAVSYGNTLALDGGGWHLASIGELDGLYDNLVAAGVCTGVNCTGNRGLFTFINEVYWSGTEFDSDEAWRLYFGDGAQLVVPKVVLLSAWAVRPADVTDAEAPEPMSVALLGLGLVGVGWSRRKK